MVHSSLALFPPTDNKFVCDVFEICLHCKFAHWANNFVEQSSKSRSRHVTIVRFLYIST